MDHGASQRNQSLKVLTKRVTRNSYFSTARLRRRIDGRGVQDAVESNNAHYNFIRLLGKIAVPHGYVHVRRAKP